MKWVELKNYLAPTFMKEIDHVCEIYISTSKQIKSITLFYYIFKSLDLIKELQKDRYNDENIESYLELKESIEDRIEEIENFYEINFDKPYAQHFEKGRIKLKKLLMFEPFVINEIKINNNNFIKKTKNIKNNVYEINPITISQNTIENYYENSNISNEFSLGNIGDQTKKAKKTIVFPRKEKIQFIPLEVKKRNNIHSVEKFKNTKNKKYKDMNDNKIYINEQINLNNQRKYKMPYNNKQYNNVLNKFKKPKMSSSMDKQYINEGYNNDYRRKKNNQKINYFIDDEN